jgi:hypothetical protein
MATTPAIRATSARVAGRFDVGVFVFKRAAPLEEIIEFLLLVVDSIVSPPTAALVYDDGLVRTCQIR